MNIHIADDNKFFTDYLSMVLPCIDWVEGIEVEKFSELSLESLEASGADVVIMDNSLPNDVDTEIIAKIKAKFPSMIVVVYAWQKYEERRERCREAGADHVFCKSSGTEYVRSVIRDVAAQKAGNVVAQEDSRLKLREVEAVKQKAVEKPPPEAQGDLSAFSRFWSKQKGSPINK